MNREDKLKEEAEFWLTYIKDWETDLNEPVPERALALLDNALLKLKNHYLEEDKAQYSQDSVFARFKSFGSLI